MSVASKNLLVVFGGEGTLWFQPTKKDRKPSEGHLVTKGKGKSVVVLRPGVCDVLDRIVLAGHSIALWSNGKAKAETPWLEPIFGKELRAKFKFTWFAERGTTVGKDDNKADVRIKESAIVAASYPDYGYKRTLFVDHDYMAHCASLPGNLLLVHRFEGNHPDVFMENWVWPMMKALEEFLEKGGTSVPQFFLSTKRPREQEMVEDFRRNKKKVLDLAVSLQKHLGREMKKWEKNAEAEQKIWEDTLDAEFPKWRDTAYDNTDMEKIVPVIPELAFEVWEGSAQELHEGALCNLCVHTSGRPESIVAKGKIVSLEYPDFAMIDIQDVVVHDDNVVNYVMRWNLEPGKQVKWLIHYLFPVRMGDEDCTSQARTFLTPIAKQRPGIHKRERKLEPYRNILVSRLRSFNDLP